MTHGAFKLGLCSGLFCMVLLQDLLGRAVDQTEGAEVEPLEKLYALLAQCIYRHRDSYDKTQLLQVALNFHTHTHTHADISASSLTAHFSSLSYSLWQEMKKEIDSFS